jgi:hypothetical protein
MEVIKLIGTLHDYVNMPKNILLVVSYGCKTWSFKEWDVQRSTKTEG